LVLVVLLQDDSAKRQPQLRSNINFIGLYLNRINLVKSSLNTYVWQGSSLFVLR
jgi:hypothetical protein